MGELTKNQETALLLIAESLDIEILKIEADNTAKDKLSFATCLNENEKIRYTKEQVKKLQAGFQSCNPKIADYVNTYILSKSYNTENHEEDKITLLSNFFLSEFSEIFDDIVADYPTKKSLIEFSIHAYFVLNGLDSKLLDEFTKQFANANRYVGFLEILNHKENQSKDAIKAIKVETDKLIKLNKDVDIFFIRIKLETLIKSSKELKVIDKAIDKVYKETCNDFKVLKDNIAALLSKLKAKSYADYLHGFKYVYDSFIKIVYDDVWHEENINEALYKKSRAKDPAIYCLSEIHYTVYTTVFKSYVTELLLSRQVDFEAAYKLPKTFSSLKEYINKGLYELEQFMDGNLDNLKYYNFPRALERFNTLRFKYENNPQQSAILFENYSNALATLSHLIDQSEFDNENAFDDENFTAMWNDIYGFSHDIVNLFTPQEIEASAPKPNKVLEILNTDLKDAPKVKHTLKQKPPSKHIAFTYSNTSVDAKYNLTECRKDLISAGFIDKSTSLANFKKIFKNELPAIPIKWTGNLSELYYLIKLLHNDKKLINSTGKEVWKITANCFVDADGNKYDYQKFRGQKNPVSKSKLDTIVSHL